MRWPRLWLPVRRSPSSWRVKPSELAAEDVLVQAEPKPGYQVTNDAQRGIVVALDTIITPELKAEGLAREVVRRIQQMRKDAGFDLSDRIHTTYRTDSVDLAGVMMQLADSIKQETLSLSLLAGEAGRRCPAPRRAMLEWRCDHPSVSVSSKLRGC